MSLPESLSKPDQAREVHLRLVSGGRLVEIAIEIAGANPAVNLVATDA